MKTSELTGNALRWAVLECENGEGAAWYIDAKGRFMEEHGDVSAEFAPDVKLAQAGPIIEREGIEVRRGNDLYFPKGNELGEYYEPLWIAGKQHGPTPLIAAMRCLVALKLGDEVEIPEELQ